MKRHGKVVSDLNRALDDARAQGSKMRSDLTAALQRVVEGEEEVRAAEQREQRMQQELEESRQREADLHERFAVLYEKEEQLATLEATLQERCDELEKACVRGGSGVGDLSRFNSHWMVCTRPTHSTCSLHCLQSRARRGSGGGAGGGAGRP